MFSYLALAGAALLVVIDQLIKVWALNQLAPVYTMQVIPGILNFTYVENYGAAFGILQQKTFFLIGLTGIVLIAGIILLVMQKFRHPLMIISLMLLIGGGAGNLVDRIFRKFVVDFIDITPLFNFPVFNFADCCVVIGTILLFIYVIFIDGKKEKTIANVAQPKKLTEGEIENK